MGNKRNHIDLHLHTFYSDGTLSPEELVRRASALGMKTIAVTDHDGINGLDEALYWGSKLGLEVIPGIEFSTIMPFGETEKYISVHLLGYGFDRTDGPLREALEIIRKQRDERNIKLLEAIRSLGYDIDEKDLYRLPGRDYIGKPDFARALLRKGYISASYQAFEEGKYLRHPKARLIRREKISAKKAIELINNAGGYCVLAHPMKIKYPKEFTEGKFELLQTVLDTLISYGLKGMECSYSSHTAGEEEKLLEMAEKLGLIATSGSDFHGPEFEPRVEIGCY